MAKIAISNIIRGCRPGRIQSVGYMQVIPLISDMTDDRFVSPEQGSEISTSDYGSMVFKNKTQNIMIVPSEATYVHKGQKAQDHAMTHAGLVKKKAQKTFRTAACVQQSQGGYLNIKDSGHMSILPFPLREEAAKVRQKSEYSKLWPAITKLNQEMGLRSYGHLEYFYDHFRKELDHFVAEFELVSNQIGAIVLINGKIVGIERTPNYEYWKSIWPALIRECYGSLAIIESKKGPPKVPDTRVEMSEVNSLQDLLDAVEDVEQREYEKVKSVVQSVCETEIAKTKISGEDEDGFQVDSLKSDRFVGQAVREDEKILYASIVCTQKFRKNEDWYSAEQFSM